MKKEKPFRPFVVAGSIVILVWVLSIILMYFVFCELDRRGQFGDSFGAVNALFSGLAFAGIIATIIMQKNELRHQKDELALTRQELENSTKAQQASERALRFQAELMAIQTILQAYQTEYNMNLQTMTKMDSINHSYKLLNSRNSELEKNIKALLTELESKRANF